MAGNAFIPGKITKVEFTMPDIAHTFKKGHRMMVQVHDRNPQQFVNIYQAKSEQFIKSDIRIYHDRNNSSGIILPVMK